MGVGILARRQHRTGQLSAVSALPATGASSLALSRPWRRTSDLGQLEHPLKASSAPAHALCGLGGDTHRSRITGPQLANEFQGLKRGKKGKRRERKK